MDSLWGQLASLIFGPAKPLFSPQPQSQVLAQQVVAPNRYAQGFPEGLKPAINEATSSAISSNLLSSVAKRENRNFATGAVNPKSQAAGLFQLTPITIRELQRQGFNRGQPVNPLDPYQASKAASFYLKYLLDQFDGDLSKTLAAYNAGPGNVRKYGGIPPFPETQSYVTSILDYMK